MDADRRIAELEAQLAARDAELAARDAELAARDQLIVELRARIVELERLVARFAGLEQKVADMGRQLGEDSTNSSRPPSTDSPTARAKRNANAQRKAGKRERRRRGGQPKHRGARRELLAADRVDDFVHFFPSHCEGCAASLPQTPDPHAKRHQVIELPAFEPHATDYLRHAVKCPCCAHITRATDTERRIPVSPFGPRLMSAIGVLTGVYHLSRRKTVALLSDLMGVKISLGAVSAVEARVSDAVEAPVREAWLRVDNARVKHTDGTGWVQAGVTLSLWVIASTVATVYKIVAAGSKATLEPLFGKRRGILVSDRATALNFWVMKRRQICWAHLLRKFVSFSERDGPAGRLGRELLEYAGILFEYWYALREGRLSRGDFRSRMKPVREQFEALLSRAVKSGAPHVAGSCSDILEHRAALWTFVDESGVEPTNNHAERELRAFVLWRKRSYGTQSERGNRFAERLMTVAHTARKQNKNVLEFLTACCVARLDGGKAPSLFAREAA